MTCYGWLKKLAIAFIGSAAIGWTSWAIQPEHYFAQIAEAVHQAQQADVPSAWESSWEQADWSTHAQDVADEQQLTADDYSWSDFDEEGLEYKYEYDFSYEQAGESGLDTQPADERPWFEQVAEEADQYYLEQAWDDTNSLDLQEDLPAEQWNYCIGYDPEQTELAGQLPTAGETPVDVVEEDYWAYQEQVDPAIVDPAYWEGEYDTAGTQYVDADEQTAADSASWAAEESSAWDLGEIDEPYGEQMKFSGWAEDQQWSDACEKDYYSSISEAAEDIYEPTWDEYSYDAEQEDPCWQTDEVNQEDEAYYFDASEDSVPVPEDNYAPIFDQDATVVWQEDEGGQMLSDQLMDETAAEGEVTDYGYYDDQFEYSDFDYSAYLADEPTQENEIATEEQQELPYWSEFGDYDPAMDAEVQQSVQTDVESPEYSWEEMNPYETDSQDWAWEYEQPLWYQEDFPPNEYEDEYGIYWEEKESLQEVLPEPEFGTEFDSQNVLMTDPYQWQSEGEQTDQSEWYEMPYEEDYDFDASDYQPDYGQEMDWEDSDADWESGYADFDEPAQQEVNAELGGFDDYQADEVDYEDDYQYEYEYQYHYDWENLDESYNYSTGDDMSGDLNEQDTDEEYQYYGEEPMDEWAGSVDYSMTDTEEMLYSGSDLQPETEYSAEADWSDVEEMGSDAYYNSLSDEYVDPDYGWDDSADAEAEFDYQDMDYQDTDEPQYQDIMDEYQYSECPYDFAAEDTEGYDDYELEQFGCDYESDEYYYEPMDQDNDYRHEFGPPIDDQFDFGLKQDYEMEDADWDYPASELEYEYGHSAGMESGFETSSDATDEFGANDEAWRWWEEYYRQSLQQEEQAQAELHGETAPERSLDLELDLEVLHLEGEPGEARWYETQVVLDLEEVSPAAPVADQFVPQPSQVEIVTGIRLFVETPNDILTPADCRLLRKLDQMWEEPPAVRRAVLNEHLERIGWQAVELAFQFEELTDIDPLDFADDLSMAAAMMAACRLVENGELSVEEAAAVLGDTLNNLPPSWHDDVRQIAQRSDQDLQIRDPRFVILKIRESITATVGSLQLAAGVAFHQVAPLVETLAKLLESPELAQADWVVR